MQYFLIKDSWICSRRYSHSTLSPAVVIATHHSAPLLFSRRLSRYLIPIVSRVYSTASLYRTARRAGNSLGNGVFDPSLINNEDRAIQCARYREVIRRDKHLRTYTSARMIQLANYYGGGRESWIFLRADLKTAFAAIKKVINNYEEQNPRNGCGLLKSNYAPRYYFSRLHGHERGDQRRSRARARFCDSSRLVFRLQ